MLLRRVILKETNGTLRYEAKSTRVRNLKYPLKISFQRFLSSQGRDLFLEVDDAKSEILFQSFRHYYLNSITFKISYYII